MFIFPGEASGCTQSSLGHACADAAPCHAGKYAAEANGAQIVDPREYYQGSLKRTLKKYPHIGKTVPAMGYSAKQVPHAGKECSCKLARILARPLQPWLPSRHSARLSELRTCIRAAVPPTYACTDLDSQSGMPWLLLEC